MDLHEKLSNKQIIHILKDHYVNYHIDNEKIIGHEEFKNMTKESKAVVRTGECTPYANIILKSGVVF